jgi:hypothetical protein
MSFVQSILHAADCVPRLADRLLRLAIDLQVRVANEPV